MIDTKKNWLQILIFIALNLTIFLILEEWLYADYEYLEYNYNKTLQLLFFIISIIVSIRFYETYKMRLVCGLSIISIVMLLINELLIEIFEELFFTGYYSVGSGVFYSIIISVILWNSFHMYRLILKLRQGHILTE